MVRTRDGEKWEKLAPPAGGEKLDFRDVESLGGEAVVLMSAGTGDAARIYRSMDGGATWMLSDTNPDKDGFYDALAFWDRQNGLVLGDPVAGRFVVRATSDGGATWRLPEGLSMPAALPNGERLFAASGTCLFALQGGQDAWFVTGGANAARVFHTRDRGGAWSAANTPAPSGNASSGLFSVAFLDARRGFAAGGDYEPPDYKGRQRHPHRGRGSDVDTGAAFADRLLLRGRADPRRERTSSPPPASRAKPSRATPAGRGRKRAMLP